MADISKATLDEVIVNIKGFHAASELRAEFKGFVTNLKVRKKRISFYKADLSVGNSAISDEYIATVEGFYNLLAQTLNTAESEYKVFLTGQEVGKIESSEL